jgi:hypothetical protein
LKLILFVPLLLLLVFTPAFGQLLSDKTGLVNRFDVETIGHSYEIKTVSNFDVIDHEFDKDEKRLTIFLTSGLENNLGEIIIPKILLGGNFTFYLNDLEIEQKIKANERISFITLNFTGVGNNKIDIIATEALVGVQDMSEPIDIPTSNGGGCLIATATFGSELSPQVQQLRELRDNQLLQTESGIAFMKSFDNFYYSFSPVIADYERENPLFKEAIKVTITPLLFSLSTLNHVEFDSEQSVIGYGIGIITLNAMMYIGLPILGIISLRKIL